MPTIFKNLSFITNELEGICDVDPLDSLSLGSGDDHGVGEVPILPGRLFSLAGTKLDRNSFINTGPKKYRFSPEFSIDIAF